MMARCWTLWTGVLVLFLAGFPVVVHSFSHHLNFNFCKWCEASSPTCKENVCFTNCSLSSFCAKIEEICIAIWRKTNETMLVQTLCHNPALPLEGVDAALMRNATHRECHMVSQPAAEGVAMTVCGCSAEHECNDKLIFDKGANGFSKLQSKDVIPVVVVSLVPLFLVAIVATAAFYFYRTRRPLKPHPSATRPDWQNKRTHELYGPYDLPLGNQQGVMVSGRNEYNWDGEMVELLPIKLDVLVGKGRFAEVWRGRLLLGDRGGQSSYETVAVKVFPSVEYISWRNECSIYSDPNLQHDNVVRFLAAEERGRSGHAPIRKYWLVLAYHSLGNLQDFLTSNTLSWEELVAMAGSIAKGVAHLHSDTTPTGVQKVPVAHRDLKSSNIVVKDRRECALCDFGLALRLDVSLTVDDYANSGQVGTARYMAPEVLESRVNLEDLEAFKQMDVYSMALVLWEMASRCNAIQEMKSYEPAFGSRVCEQPCVDSMRDLVLRDRGRPEIPSTWTQHQGMNILCSTVTECWDHDPEARLTAHCVVERIHALQTEGEEEQRANLANESSTTANGQHTHTEKDSETPDNDQTQTTTSFSTAISTDSPVDSQTDLHTDGLANGQTDTHTDGLANGQTDTHTEKDSETPENDQTASFTHSPC